MTPKQGMYIGIGASVGLIVVIVIIVLLVMGTRNSIGSPTEETAPAVLKKIELKLDISRITTPPPAEDTGAAALYLAAVKEMVALGDDFAPSVRAEIDPDKKPAFKSIVEKLEEAADKGLGKAELNFESVLPITPGPYWAIRDKLYAMGQLSAKSAMSKRAEKNKEGAEKSARATLIFGERLFNNGAFVPYKAAALGCVSEGLAAYEAHYSERFFHDAAKESTAKQMYAWIAERCDLFAEFHFATPSHIKPPSCHARSSSCSARFHKSPGAAVGFSFRSSFSFLFHRSVELR